MTADRRAARFVLPLLAACAAAGCDRAGGADGDPKVVVYCSVDPAFAAPILKEFERRTGVRVEFLFDTEAGKTTGLVERLLAEKDRPRADVWWSSEIFGTIDLARRGVLTPYGPNGIDEIPSSCRDPSGHWTAVGLRGRVVAYDPARVGSDEQPTQWSDLTDPRFRGRICMADPRFGTTRGHMAVLLSLWGREKMISFYRGLKENGCRLTDGNAQSVQLVRRGTVDFGMTDTDDVIVAQSRGDSVAMVYPLIGSSPSSGGALWIPCSVGLVKGGPRPGNGQRLIDYLVSAEVEEKLHASDSRNVPVRAALRERLRAGATGEIPIDYAAAAALLEESDALVRDILLK